MYYLVLFLSLEDINCSLGSFFVLVSRLVLSPVYAGQGSIIEDDGMFNVQIGAK